MAQQLRKTFALRPTRSIVPLVAEATGWKLHEHIDRVYDQLRYRAGRFPKLFTRPGEHRPAVQQSLMDFSADLGVRHKMDWPGFLRRHQAMLQPLAALPRLGRLSEAQIDTVVEVVAELDRFKHTKGCTLVLGSKAAHIHFPATVPITASEVVTGLKALQRSNEPELTAKLGRDGPWFRFTDPVTRRLAYRHYVALGNAVMAEVDARRLLGMKKAPPYDLHAKLWQWFVISRR